MILVDTSVWIDHFRKGVASLKALLDAGQVLGHPFVVGELALGNLHRRNVILDALQALPQASVATESEVLRFIDQESLHGLGIGYVDAHLLAAVRLSPGSRLWTRHKRLLSRRNNCSYLPACKSSS
jgi:predicted nucleic acid-binding protein